MRAIVFARHKNELADILGKHIAKRDSSISYNVFPVFDNFVQSLKEPKIEETLVVYFAENISDMNEITSNRGILWKTRLVFILSQSDKEMVSLAHSLYPRFIGYADMSFENICSVIEKMIGLLRAD